MKPLKVTLLVIEGLTPADLPDLLGLINGDLKVTTLTGRPVETTQVTVGRPEANGHAVPDPEDAVAAREASGRPPHRDEPEPQPVSTFCAVCLEQQLASDGGVTCPNGHGGADSLSRDEALARQEAVREARNGKGKGEGAQKRPARQRAVRTPQEALDALPAAPPVSEPPPEREPGSDDEEIVEDPGEEPQETPGAPAPLAALPPEIASARRLSIVLDYLKGRGFDGEDLVHEVIRLKDQIGIMVKVTNPEERIRRALLTM